MHICLECGGVAIDVQLMPKQANGNRMVEAYAYCVECGHRGPTVKNTDPQIAKRCAQHEWNHHADLCNRSDGYSNNPERSVKDHVVSC